MSVGKGAHLILVGIFGQSFKKKKTLYIDLVGPGARCDIVLLVLGAAHHTSDMDIVCTHHASNTHSRIAIRVLLSGAATHACIGRVQITPRARASSTQFFHRSLLLSDDARVYAVPSLEIETSETQASHAVSMSRIDEEARAYIQSRGLSRQDADTLIARGFALADTNLILHRSVAARYEKKADASLQNFLPV